MNLIVNGIKTSFENVSTVDELIDELKKRELAPEHPYFAIAVNMKCVAKAEYEKTFVKDSDEIEILSPMQGG